MGTEFLINRANQYSETEYGNTRAAKDFISGYEAAASTEVQIPNRTHAILNRLKTILADYQKAGFENSANITKYIISEIEEIVKL